MASLKTGKRRIRRFFVDSLALSRQLSMAKMIGAYGIAQSLVLAAGLLRIPVVAANCTAEVVGYWFLWLGVLPWGSLLASGPTNLARIEAASTGKLLATSAMTRKPSLILAVLIPVSMVLALTQENAIWFGALPTILLWTTQIQLSRFVGYQFGRGKANIQFLFQAAGAIASLAFALAMVRSSFWPGLTAGQQVASLCVISGIGTLAPPVLAKISSRSAVASEVVLAQVSLRRYVTETSATLPPAYIGGLDSVSLLWTGHTSDLVTYGVYSRLVTVVTLVPAAIYVQVNNLMLKSSERNQVKIARVGTALVAANLPFIGLLLAVHHWLVPQLSQGTAESNTACALAISLLGLALPLWIAVSGAAQSFSTSRLRLGQVVMRNIVPFSVGSTLLLAWLFSSAGPFAASAVTYLFACVIISRQIRALVPKNGGIEVIDSGR